MNLEEFLVSKIRNSWLELDVPMSLYARKSSRMVNGSLIKVFDIASVESANPGRGTFSGFIDRLEKKIEEVGLDGVYVESILNPRFAALLERRGYIKTNKDEICLNMFKQIRMR